MTDDEIREEFAKIQAQKAKQREYMARPEVKAKMAEYNKDRNEKRKSIIERARELGLDV